MVSFKTIEHICQGLSTEYGLSSMVTHNAFASYTVSVWYHFRKIHHLELNHMGLFWPENYILETLINFFEKCSPTKLEKLFL